MENKQRIIEQIVAGPKHIHPVVNKAPLGIHNKSSENENNGKKLPQNGRESKKSSELWKTAHKLNGKKSLWSSINRDAAQVEGKESTRERKEFIAIGDSMLDNI